MALEIIGKVQQFLPQQSGVGKNGASWSKQEFVIETLEQYPRKVCISVWGDKSEGLERQYPVGTTVKAGINIESREYNGKWYTDVRAWRIDLATAEQTPEGITIADYGNVGTVTNNDNIGTITNNDSIGTFVDDETDEMLPF